MPPSSGWASPCSIVASAGLWAAGRSITPEARDLMIRYQAVAADAEQALQKVFQRHFADWKDPAPAELPQEAPALPDEPPGDL